MHSKSLSLHRPHGNSLEQRMRPAAHSLHALADTVLREVTLELCVERCLCNTSCREKDLLH